MSILDKIVKKVIVGQISRFLEDNCILSGMQHGFRKGRCRAKWVGHNPHGLIAARAECAKLETAIRHISVRYPACTMIR